MTIIVDSSDRTNYSDLVRDVRRLAPMLVEPLVLPIIAEVAREFCRKSSCWRTRRLTLLTTQAGVQTYSYTDLPSDADLYRVNSAWCDGDEVPVLQPGQEDAAEEGSQSDDMRIGVAGPSDFLLSPAPLTSGRVITGGITVIPKLSATSMPTALVDQYRVGIAYGVLAKMALEADKPWGRLNIAPIYQGEYDLAIARASNDAGPIRPQPLRVKPY